MSNKRKKRPWKVNATGRNEGERWANFGYPIMQSAAWRNLSGSALKVLMELRTRFNGGNNGTLALPLDHAANILGIGKATVKRALDELREKGFLIETDHGSWYGHKPTLWALTMLPVDGKPATQEWKQWTPPEKQILGSRMEPLVSLTNPFQNR